MRTCERCEKTKTLSEGMGLCDTCEAESMRQHEARRAAGVAELEKSRPIVRLSCCCCGESTTGRQWWNRDTGFGLCPKCAKWLSDRETPEEMKSCYGVEGIHYNIKD